MLSFVAVTTCALRFTGELTGGRLGGTGDGAGSGLGVGSMDWETVAFGGALAGGGDSFFTSRPDLA